MATAKRRFGDTSSNNAPQDGPATKTARTTLAPNPRIKECAICADDLPLKSFPPRLGHRTHNQRHSTCTACWQHHLTSEIASKPSTQIRCPQCPYALQEPDIKAHVTPATYTAYLDKVLLETLQADPNYRTCRRRYCVRCEVPMHKGVTCEEFQGQLRRRQDQEEKTSREFLEGYAKTCPECGVRIRKDGGCDHMTCKRCKHEFCWLCFASYNGAEGIHRVGNEAHNETCQYHPDRLPSAPSDLESEDDLDEEEVARLFAWPRRDDDEHPEDATPLARVVALMPPLQQTAGPAPSPSQSPTIPTQRPVVHAYNARRTSSFSPIPDRPRPNPQAPVFHPYNARRISLFSPTPD
ncbi:hypothetical protein M409DRAFT_56313 [Zasmidium cellare ATCC 36951]|uniref:RBR-type E3 ubiquitin transferase n=1 Tax=Zasmidium cellare ATCC 36951 TaxID=1080233 RepID=A0A6A6CD05_ZASCE|nr:uncharacterized protein M409DRAFT_56313 [Zasmidium cellare ATCC 36951]KAF2164965.1 hypothetical protein M409DRAFT_56313 [Zasmidium cellare ATCC 36951]